VKTIVLVELFSVLATAITLLGMLARNEKMSSSITYRNIEIFMIVWLLADMGSYHFDVTMFPKSVLWIINLISFLCGSIVICMYAFYVKTLIQEKVVISNKIVIFPVIATFFSVLFITVSFIQGKVAEFIEDRYVNTGGVPAFSLFLQLAVLIYLLAVVIKYYSYIGISSAIAMTLYGVVPLIVSAICTSKGYDDYAVATTAILISLTAELLQNNNVYKLITKSNEELTNLNEELVALNEEIKEHMELEVEYKLKEEMMIQKKQQSEEITLLLIKTLSDTIEAKDEYTRGHSKRVSEYAALIAEKMNLSKEDISRIKYAATLHDIGKIGVPDTVLNKPSRLTEEEYEIIKTHCTIGSDILQNVEMISYTADIARHHHERYDGKGYPDGLKGEENSIGARIVAVADAFDAMNSERIYRKPLSREIIVNEIEKNKGNQFDPQIATVFLELLASGAVDELDLDSKSADSDEDRMTRMVNNEAGELLSVVVNTMKNSNSAGSIDFLTGLLLRGSGEEQIVSLMKESNGALIFCDMDNLKTINDRFGHKAGDRALKLLGNTIGKYSEKGIACRVGGDEFLLYLDDVNEDKVKNIMEQMIADFANDVANDVEINMATLSMGVCMSTPLDIYSEVLSKADKALYHVKQRGKAGYYIYYEEKDSPSSDNHVDIKKVKESIAEAGRYNGALDVEYRQFAKFYEYLYKVCERYKHSCSVVLVTLDSKANKTMYIESIEQDMHYMDMAIKNTIRNVDICTRYSSVQFLIVLMEAGNDNIDSIMKRIFATYYKMSNESDLIPRYEASTL